MKREDLVKLGVGEELVGEIMKLHGLDIEDHKRKLQEADTNTQTLTNQLNAANTAIQGFKELDIEGMKKSVGEWETKYATLQQESADKLAKTHFDYDLDNALKAAKVKNPKLAKALLDEKLLKHDVEKHSFEGLEEQLNKAKETDGYLFDTEEETMTIIKGGDNKSVVGDKMVDAATASLHQSLGISK